jgi:hypothetical protein
VVSWSPSAQNKVIWTSRISHADCVPEVFDCKEVVSWCVLTFSFRAFSLALQQFFSSSSREACENYQFYHEEGSYLLLRLKNSGLLSYWVGSFERCCRMSYSWQWWSGIGQSSHRGLFPIICTIQWSFAMSLGRQRQEQECC